MSICTCNTAEKEEPESEDSTPAIQEKVSTSRHSARGGTTTGKCGEHCGETKRQQGHHHQEHGSALQDPTSYALHGSTSNHHSASGERDYNLACCLHMPWQYHIVVHHCNDDTRGGSTASITANWATAGGRSMRNIGRCIFGRIETVRCLTLTAISLVEGFHYGRRFCEIHTTN